VPRETIFATNGLTNNSVVVLICSGVPSSCPNPSGTEFLCVVGCIEVDLGYLIVLLASQLPLLGRRGRQWFILLRVGELGRRSRERR